MSWPVLLVFLLMFFPQDRDPSIYPIPRNGPGPHEKICDNRKNSTDRSIITALEINSLHSLRERSICDIGANDVANNVGPAVGSRALSLAGALIIAAVFGSAGALMAGGDVVNTIAKGIIDPALVPDTQTFIWVMMAALLSSALWVNLATYFGAPVSTTHAVVGGVMGAGIAAIGFSAVNWVTMGKIAASWVISPVMGGVIAALFPAFIKVNIIYQDDKIAAARLITVPAAAVLSALIYTGLALLR